MSHDYSEVQTAFLEGTEEIFTELFTDKAKLYMLDLENTEVDTLYEEAMDKHYKEPIEVVAKVELSRSFGEFSRSFGELSRSFGELLPETVGTTANVRIPSKVLIDLDIPFETEQDLKALEQCLIEYRGMKFNIAIAKPTVLVGDTYIFMDLSCTELIT